MQRTKDQNNTATGVTNGTDNNINEHENLNSWAQQTYNVQNAPITQTQYVSNYYGTSYPYHQAYGIGDSANGWTNGDAMAAAYVGSYNNGQVAPDAYNMETMFSAANVGNVFPNPFGGPAGGPPNGPAYGFFPCASEYSAAWNAAAVATGKQPQCYEDYYREGVYNIDQRLHGLDISVADSNLNKYSNYADGTTTSKNEHFLGSSSMPPPPTPHLHQHQNHVQLQQHEKKATTWASIASQPAKPTPPPSSGTGKKKPGMPPPPVTPSKMDVGMWETKNNVPPPKAPAVIQPAISPPNAKSVWPGPMNASETSSAASFPPVSSVPSQQHNNPRSNPPPVAVTSSSLPPPPLAGNTVPVSQQQHLYPFQQQPPFQIPKSIPHLYSQQQTNSQPSQLNPPPMHPPTSKSPTQLQHQSQQTPSLKKQEEQQHTPQVLPQQKLNQQHPPPQKLNQQHPPPQTLNQHPPPQKLNQQHPLPQQLNQQHPPAQQLNQQHPPPQQLNQQHPPPQKLHQQQQQHPSLRQQRPQQQQSQNQPPQKPALHHSPPRQLHSTTTTTSKHTSDHRSTESPPAAVVNSSQQEEAASTSAAEGGSAAHVVLEKYVNKHEYNPSEFDLSAKGARFFVIKSYSEDDIHRSIKYEIWCSTEHGNVRLDDAFHERKQNNGVVYLLYSVNGSGYFCGMAQMLSPVDYCAVSKVWEQDKWKGQFKVRWIYVKDVPNGKLRHIQLENNDNKPVTNSRDAQEVPHNKGVEVLKIIHTYKHSTSIFDDFTHYDKKQEQNNRKPITYYNAPPSRNYSHHGNNNNNNHHHHQQHHNQDSYSFSRNSSSYHRERDGGNSFSNYNRNNNNNNNDGMNRNNRSYNSSSNNNNNHRNHYNDNSNNDYKDVPPRS